jgi:hypothetical protein
MTPVEKYLQELRKIRSSSVRVAALLLLGPKLDANYAAVKSNTYP